VFVVAEVEETLGLFDEDDDNGDDDDAESRVTMRTPTWNDDRISNYTIMSDICLYAHIYVVMPQGTVSL